MLKVEGKEGVPEARDCATMKDNCAWAHIYYVDDCYRVSDMGREWTINDIEWTNVMEQSQNAYYMVIMTNISK